MMSDTHQAASEAVHTRYFAEFFAGIGLVILITSLRLGAFTSP